MFLKQDIFYLNYFKVDIFYRNLHEFTMNNNSLENMELYCNVTEIPPLTITPIERQYLGRTVKIPGEMTFGDLSTDIINTESFQVRNEIEKWMDLINGHMNNRGFSDSSSMYGQAEIKQVQKDGSQNAFFSFVDIWPTTVGEIALSYDTANDMETFNVTWAYNYYEALGINNANDSTFQN